MRFRLLLARHGETQANVDRVLDTRRPGPPLTARGRSQAAALGIWLAAQRDRWPIAAVYASEMTRATQTASAVADAVGLTVRTLLGVHEVAVGELEGRNDDAAVARFRAAARAWHDGDLDARPPGGESGTQVLARYRKAIEEVRAAHPGGTVLVVSHGAATRLAAWSLAPGDARLHTIDHLHNTGLIVLETTDGFRWHCAGHYPGEMPEHGDPTGGDRD